MNSYCSFNSTEFILWKTIRKGAKLINDAFCLLTCMWDTPSIVLSLPPFPSTYYPSLWFYISLPNLQNCIVLKACYGYNKFTSDLILELIPCSKMKTFDNVQVVRFVKVFQMFTMSFCFAWINKVGQRFIKACFSEKKTCFCCQQQPALTWMI